MQNYKKKTNIFYVLLRVVTGVAWAAELRFEIRDFYPF